MSVPNLIAADHRWQPRYEYLWEDGVRYKKATKLPAPEYVDALMNWAQGLLDNEDIFPSEMGASLGPWGTGVGRMQLEDADPLIALQASRSRRTSGTRSVGSSGGSSGCTRTCTATTLTTSARSGSKVRTAGGAF